MSNLFQEVLDDSQAVSDKLMGPSYPYYSNIKTPKEIGMSDEGSLSALGSDINGLISYVEVLVSGKSNASRSGNPLGNKFFLNTGATCKDIKTNQDVERYIYVNNVPVGNIPFISSGMGVNFSEMRGLIPGIMGNLNVLNPFGIMQAFLAGSNPDCQEITMETINNKDVKSSEKHYVTLVDIKNMDPCLFNDKKNPVNGANCRETYQTMTISKEPLDQLYYMSLAFLGVYIISRIVKK
jgi:hypothetical protein